ncbi:MAG: 4-hydroxythreonine-4-phosphate dehydrogenase PdxA [Pseudomonadota bacterium]|jgi:4-hydroxythreonine-4-phosphate dehydrogenase
MFASPGLATAPLALPCLAITTGEPAGIGPEISLRAAFALRDQVRCVLLGDASWLALLAHEVAPQMQIMALNVQAVRNSGLPHVANPDCITVIDCPVAVPVQAGQLDARNGKSVLQMLDLALEGIAAHWFDGMVTAPLQKSTINQAGVAFTGHTEYLAQQTASAQVVMMLAGPRMAGPRMAGPRMAGPRMAGAHADAAEQSGLLRVALATTHLPLRQVAESISQPGLLAVLRIIHADLQRYFGLSAPRILVTGLNPHAGENGYLGREEIDIIAPAIAQARAEGMDARGPFPADTLFQDKYLDQADCVLAMYHDQGLPVLKYASFGQGVNITLGLPLVRTSVDHGTALDLAAQGIGLADAGSMEQAIRCAMIMAYHAKQSGQTPSNGFR